MKDTNLRKNVLVEIGVEDLPPTVFHLANFIAEYVEEHLVADGFKSKLSSPHSFFTLRRLAFRIDDLVNELPSKIVERKGPAIEKAYDADGNPTTAALGFAKSCGVDVAALEQKDNRLFCRYQQSGATLDKRLQLHLQDALNTAPLNDRMRWSDSKHQFVRPIRWLVALYDKQPLDIELMGVRSGSVSYGHRVYCDKPLTITSAEDGVYEKTLEKKGNVIVSYQKRQVMIKTMLGDTFSDLDSDAYTDWINDIQNFYGNSYEVFDDGSGDVVNAIVKESAAMVEYPYAVTGTFDAIFNERLPRPIIIQALMKNQYLFLGLDGDQLSNRFLAITNIKPNNDNMTRGFERVAHPRLEDAMFFIDKDTKTDVSHLVQLLGKSVFHKDLGSLADKSTRIGQLSQSIISLLQKENKQFTVDTNSLLRASELCKLDLMTATVNEYPALQGEVGRYCLTDDTVVAQIVSQHYMPRYANAPLPETAEACILALADRLDSLVGIFGTGNQPTGSKDPYALRRASIASIRLLFQLGDYFEAQCNQRLKIDFFQLIDCALKCYSNQSIPTFSKDNMAAVKQYLLERLKPYYLSMSFPQPISIDQINAVSEVKPQQLFDLSARLHAINAFSHSPHLNLLVAINKRIKNILSKNDNTQISDEINESMLQKAAEKTLYSALQQCQQAIEEPVANQDYSQVLSSLEQLHHPISEFFDQVLVMVDDEKLRDNRICLLHHIRQLFMQIGDFSKLNITTENDETISH